MGDRGTRPGGGTALWQNAALVVLAAVTIVLCFFAVTRNADAGPSAGLDGSGSGQDAGTGSGSGEATEAPTDDVTAEPSDEPAPAQDPPEVADLRNADFTTGAGLPKGARTFDNPSVGSPLVLADDALAHGAPVGPDALSSLEARLAGPVQKLSARVRFPAQAPGSVVLVAWQDSFVDARTAGRPVPASGLRLVASADSWQLTTYEKAPRVFAQGTYDAVDGPATFTVTRQGDVAWVEDPIGTVTQVQDPLIESLAGPWACWQLLEQTADQTPAVIEAVSAG